MFLPVRRSGQLVPPCLSTAIYGGKGVRTCPAPTGDTRRMFLPVRRSGQLVSPKGNVDGGHYGAAEERKGRGKWRRVKSSDEKYKKGKKQ